MSYEQRSFAGAAADTTLASGITSSSLSFTVATGTGTGYPDGSGGPFYVVIDYDNSKAEKILVTSRSGDTFTLPDTGHRGMDGTTAQAHDAATAKVRHCITAVDMQEANRAALNTIGKVASKGDTLAGTGANALARVAAGADNTVFVADSTQTAGVNYKTLAALLQTLATTKGDLLVSNGTTVVRLPVGADGTVLTASSSPAPGMVWATAPTAVGNAIYGDGSDGSATLDGTNTVAWATKVGSTYTMTRHAYLTSLTINNGVTLIPAGWYPFVNGTLTNNGTISMAGGNGSGTTGGSAQTVSGVLGSGGGGGTGATGTGSGGGSNSATLGGAGGAAGGVSGNGGNGGSGTATTQFVRSSAVIANPRDFTAGTWNPFSGGGGGGGGGGDGVHAGGGGGAGGGVIILAAKTITNGATGVITAAGGNGASGSTANSGGGGGGGGGAVILIYNTLTNSGSITAAAGTKGTNQGTATGGANGTAGIVVQIAN